MSRVRQTTDYPQEHLVKNEQVYNVHVSASLVGYMYLTA